LSQEKNKGEKMKIEKKKLVKEGQAILYCRVTEETKAKLIKLAQELGYGPRVGLLVNAIVKDIK
jgi:magnesium-transporting ATPase (P-type)